MNGVSNPNRKSEYLVIGSALNYSNTSIRRVISDRGIFTERMPHNGGNERIYNEEQINQIIERIHVNCTLTLEDIVSNCAVIKKWKRISVSTLAKYCFSS